MKAVMLAAGRGLRLSQNDETYVPKALLGFGGKTLLQRHIECLRAHGVAELVLVVGYHADEVRAEIAALGAGGFVRTIDNPAFRRGSVVSLWTARDALAAGDAILFMDADVLYDPVLIERLTATRHANCFLIDREFEPGDEPVKLCLRAGVPVEFRKIVDSVDFDVIGEWPGFLRLAPATAARLAAALETYIAAGRLDEPYEEAIRDVMLDHPPEPFGVEDITGIPWIEIDFPEDLARAHAETFPRLPR